MFQNLFIVCCEGFVKKQRGRRSNNSSSSITKTNSPVKENIRSVMFVDKAYKRLRQLSSAIKKTKQINLKSHNNGNENWSVHNRNCSHCLINDTDKCCLIIEFIEYYAFIGRINWINHAPINIYIYLCILYANVLLLFFLSQLLLPCSPCLLSALVAFVAA